MKTGEVVWFDIAVTNFEAAKSFYGELLGWKFMDSKGEDNPDYWVIKAGEDMIGGFKKAQAKSSGSDGATLYFSVSDLEGSITRAKKLGATLSGEIVDIGNGMGRFQCLKDKDLNLFAIWSQN